uniref:F-box domain-containing protein n=1 Tax=Oryza sativa TaxID=4530 RepID=Q9LLN2_ORYSA|nr:hypothetical protein [Oryza sativa]
MASGADRISDLPDDVIHHVLSLLPSRDAVRTCALARRWRDLWRSVPAVRVAGDRGWASFDALARFVDSLLRLRRGGAALDACDFDLRFDGAFPGEELQGDTWIRRALRRQVRALRFAVSTHPRVPIPLSDSPLVSHSLTTLELRGVQGNDQVLDFSSCPSLVDLKMKDCYVGGLEMWSPSLKHLSITYCVFYCDYRTRMDFPSLVTFKFNTNTGRTPLLETMPSLATAAVRLDHFCHDRCANGWYDDCGDAGCKGCHDYYRPDEYDCVFLEGLTEATDLTLLAYSKVVPKNLVGMDGSFNQLEQPFAASHLQIVEIYCREVDGIILKILKVLNANGVPLEKISIRCSGCELSMNTHASYYAVVNMCCRAKHCP